MIREALANAIEACLLAEPMPGPTFRAYLSRSAMLLLAKELAPEERLLIDSPEGRPVPIPAMRLFDPRWGSIDIETIDPDGSGGQGFVLARMPHGSVGYFPVANP